MKFIYNFTFLNYKEGEKNGKKWKGIEVQDEDHENFIIYGEGSEKFKNEKAGNTIEVMLTLNNYTDYKNNQKRLSLRVVE